MTAEIDVTMTVNGERVSARVQARITLADFLRDHLGLTGTHVGCEHGVCGACTILVNGESLRSCIVYAVQFAGADVSTVEALSGADGELHPIQEAFRECHGLQCGFCTPGMTMSVFEFLSEEQDPTEAEVRAALSGNLCRCTGYQSIVEAVMRADETWERSIGGASEQLRTAP